MTDFVARVSAAKRWLVGARTFRPARKAIFLESALQSWGQRGIYHAWTAMRTSRSVALGAVMAAVVATSVSGNTRLDYVAQRARWTVLGGLARRKSPAASQIHSLLISSGISASFGRSGNRADCSSARTGWSLGTWRLAPFYEQALQSIWQLPSMTSFWRSFPPFPTLTQPSIMAAA